MLFADTFSSDFGHGATVITVALAAVTAVSNWLNNREQRLANRDRLEADNEKQQLRLENAVHTERELHCQELKVEVAQLRAAMTRHGIECPDPPHQPASPAPPGGSK